MTVPLAIHVDHREHPSGLIQALSERWRPVDVRQLGVGDVRIGDGVVIERKTTQDFVTSFSDSRLYDQCWRLSKATGRPLLIVEGSDAAPMMRLRPEVLRGILLSITIGYRIPVLRTESTVETADLIVHIAEQQKKRLARFLEREGYLPPVPEGLRSVNAFATVPGMVDMKGGVQTNRDGNDVEDLPF